MEAFELVRLLVNKAVVPPTPRRRGNPGYGRLGAVRLLVYARLAGLENDTRIVAHLARHRYAARALGFRQGVPDRTTVGRWWERYAGILKEVFDSLSGMVQTLIPTRLLVVDSTPLVDLYDLEAEWGFTSRGAFRGFKLHTCVNQHSLPLRALVTPGNRHDSPWLPSLVQDLEADYVVADAGYDSKANREAVEAIGAKPIIASNPRRGRRHRMGRKELLALRKRYLAEQLHSLVKGPLLKGCWTRPRGLVKKAAAITAGLIGLNSIAVKAILEDGKPLRTVSQYWA